MCFHAVSQSYHNPLYFQTQKLKRKQKKNIFLILPAHTEYLRLGNVFVFKVEECNSYYEGENSAGHSECHSRINRNGEIFHHIVCGS